MDGQISSTFPGNTSGIGGTLPRPTKQSTGLFCTLASLGSGFRVPPQIKKEQIPKGYLLFFGARDGTRTHTAVATRTSNVLVYHSNTLASVL